MPCNDINAILMSTILYINTILIQYIIINVWLICVICNGY